MEEEVFDRITTGVAKPKKYKLAIFICGASGTGKSSMRDKFIRDAKIKTSLVYLNIDNIKEVGREEARVIFNKLIDKSVDEGYSILYDGTCRNKKDVTELMKKLKSKDYKIIVGMTYTTLPTALKRLEDRRGQYVPETVARDIYQHMKKNAEVYMTINYIDEMYLYNNEEASKLIFKRKNKQIDCILPNEDFYFDVSKYCD